MHINILVPGSPGDIQLCLVVQLPVQLDQKIRAEEGIKNALEIIEQVLKVKSRHRF